VYSIFLKDTDDKAAAVFKTPELQQIEQVLFLAVTLLPCLFNREKFCRISSSFLGRR